MQGDAAADCHKLQVEQRRSGGDATTDAFAGGAEQLGGQVVALARGDGDFSGGCPGHQPRLGTLSHGRGQTASQAGARRHAFDAAARDKKTLRARTA